MDYISIRLAQVPFPDINPVIFSIGPISVYWYGAAYVAGIILGWLYARRLVDNERLWMDGKPTMTRAELDDFLLWAAVGIVAGGRIGYVLFYDFAAVAANPLRLLAVWEGGMSFHGGMLGTILAIIFFAHRRGVNVWSLLDVIAAVAPIGLFFGRIANFINSELWGRPTDVAWGVVFPNGGPLPRHPSQLYEAILEGLILFLVLRLLTHQALKLKTPRFVGGAFIAGYGAARIFVEFFREPDAHIGYLAGGWLTMGMLLSLPMVLVGIWGMVTAKPATAIEHTGKAG